MCLRLHHLPGEDVVARRHRLAVAEARVAVELEVERALVVLHRPVRGHQRDEVVGDRVARHEPEAHREGRFQPAKASFEFGPISRKVSG